MRKQKRIHRWFRKAEHRAMTTRYLAAELLGLRGEELYAACGLYGQRVTSIWEFEDRMVRAKLIRFGDTMYRSREVTEKGERYLRGEL